MISLDLVYCAGAMILPHTSAFKNLMQGSLSASGKSNKAVVFATGGERGILKIWRSDTAECIYEQR